MPDIQTPRLVGQTIKAVRPMTAGEMEANGWDEGRRGSAPLVIELSSGMTMYASRDDEGNGPGTLFGTAPDGTPIYIQGE